MQGEGSHRFGPVMPGASGAAGRWISYTRPARPQYDGKDQRGGLRECGAKAAFREVTDTPPNERDGREPSGVIDQAGPGTLGILNAMRISDVPEPASALGLASGLLLMISRRRSR